MGSKKKNDVGPDKNSDEYREKRRKNNNAVKRSRDKSKAKAMESQARVQQLQMENESLRSTVDTMTSELQYLKDMLVSHAGSLEYLSPGMQGELDELLKDDCPTDIHRLTIVLTQMRRLQEMQKNGEFTTEYQANGSFYENY